MSTHSTVLLILSILIDDWVPSCPCQWTMNQQLLIFFNASESSLARVLLQLLLLLLLEASLAILIYLWGLCSAAALTQTLTMLPFRNDGEIWIVGDYPSSPPSLSSHQKVAKAVQSHSSSPEAVEKLDHQILEVDCTPPSQGFFIVIEELVELSNKQQMWCNVIGNVKLALLIQSDVSASIRNGKDTISAPAPELPLPPKQASTIMKPWGTIKISPGFSVMKKPFSVTSFKPILRSQDPSWARLCGFCLKVAPKEFHKTS